MNKSRQTKTSSTDYQSSFYIMTDFMFAAIFEGCVNMKSRQYEFKTTMGNIKIRFVL